MEEDTKLKDALAKSNKDANEHAIANATAHFDRPKPEKPEKPEKPKDAKKTEPAPRRTLAQARADIQSELDSIHQRREVLREKSLNINRELHASAMTADSLERLLDKFS